jgi:hypothetical protein
MALFKLYETIYLTDSYGKQFRSELFNKLCEGVVNLMSNRLKKYSAEMLYELSVNSESALDVPVVQQELLVDQETKTDVPVAQEELLVNQETIIKDPLAEEVSLEYLIFPIRLLHNLSKESHYQLADKYALWMDAPYPTDLLKNDWKFKKLF